MKEKLWKILVRCAMIFGLEAVALPKRFKTFPPHFYLGRFMLFCYFVEIVIFSFISRVVALSLALVSYTIQVYKSL